MIVSATDAHHLAKKHIATHPRPLVVVLGPTASGKTAFSIELAQRFDPVGEVVNADSRQLYRYLDIGTAKITSEEMQGVPHHLLSVLDPAEEASAGWYQTEARRVIDNILERGRVPLLVGGSMLYLSSVIDNLTMAPSSDDTLRQQLLEQYDHDDGHTLHARLQEIDPEAADSIHPNNKPRLIRAVEIYELTRQPKSAGPREELRTGTQSTGYNLCILGMHTDRAVLMERIDERAQQMFAAGWLDEVRMLIDRGYTADDPAMKSHGYREMMHYLEHGEPETIEELQALITKKTRRYSKQQVSWWSTDSRITWVTPS